MHDTARIKELKSTIDYAVTNFSKERSFRLDMSYAEFLKMKTYLDSIPAGDKYCIIEGGFRSSSIEKPYYIVEK